MKKHWIILALLSLGLLLAGCDKQPAGNEDVNTETEEARETRKLRYYANTFARNYMDVYYLWNKEIASGIKAWKDMDEPISKVDELRYKDASGKDIDKWTMLTDDFSSFYGSVSGTQKTYGFDFILMYLDSSHTTICAVVTYTYADSPAAAAGLKRGDVIVEVNGKTMTGTNYSKIVNNELLGGDKLTVSLYDGGSKTMTSKEMYENPVLISKVFDCGDKKVGYLFYTSFTLDSCKDLVTACKSFKEAGVTELILDLRYNGGGFVITEGALASMLAPEAEVKAGSVLSTQVYNADLTAYFQQSGSDTKTYFKTEFNIGSSNDPVMVSTAGANIGLTKLYGIISSGSASASEALLCDLYPYMDVTLIGEQSHGKYCSGTMWEAEEFFTTYAGDLGASVAAEGKRYTKNWGIYLMVSRFADKNGETRCMPDGLKPDYPAEDVPYDGYQLGDPQETMLARALALCGYKAKAQAARRPAVRLGERIETEPHRADFGRFILLPEQF